MKMIYLVFSLFIVWRIFIIPGKNKKKSPSCMFKQAVPKRWIIPNHKESRINTHLTEFRPDQFRPVHNPFFFNRNSCGTTATIIDTSDNLTDLSGSPRYAAVPPRRPDTSTTRQPCGSTRCHTAGPVVFKPPPPLHNRHTTLPALVATSDLVWTQPN